MVPAMHRSAAVVTAPPRRTPHAVYVIQDTGYPRDRRIRRQAQTLVAAGWRVTVVAARLPGEPRREVVDGVDVRRYRVIEARHSTAAFLLEFANSFVRAGALTLRAGLRPGTRMVQTANPPDTMFPVLWLLQRFGRRAVFDQHELMPELSIARFGRERPLMLRALRLAERCSYRVADLVVATNETYAATARERGGVPADRVVVVRNGPDRSELVPGRVRPDLVPPGRSLLAFVGVMGPQDGGDRLLDAVADLVVRRGRTDVHVAVLGDGPSLPDLRAQARALGIADHVTFTGWISDQQVLRDHLATATVCVSPEPSDPFNDASTFIKIMEYLAAGAPVAAFDLPETRASAGAAARYAEPSDPVRLADVIAELLDDPALRDEMGAEGLRRIEERLGWWHEAPRYAAAIGRVTGVAGTTAPAPAPAPARVPAEVTA